MGLHISRRRLAEFSGKLYSLVKGTSFYPGDEHLYSSFNSAYGESLTSKTFRYYVATVFKKRPVGRGVLSRSRRGGMYYYKFREKKIAELIKNYDMGVGGTLDARAKLAIGAFFNLAPDILTVDVLGILPPIIDNDKDDTEVKEVVKQPAQQPAQQPENGFDPMTCGPSLIENMEAR